MYLQSQKSWLLLLGATLGLMLVGLVFLCEGQAVAQSETELVSTTVNPTIDCSTNPGYSDQYIASAFKAAGHVGGRNQQCNSCHNGANPRVGEGDRPIAKQGTALIENLLSKPVRYEVRVGKKGDWEKFVLQPGAVRRHSWPYKKPNENRSPEYYLRYDGDPEQKERKLTLIATPNPKLGSVYFFDQEDKDVYLYAPKRQVSR